MDSFKILPGYHGTLVRDDYTAYAKYDKDLAAVLPSVRRKLTPEVATPRSA